MLILSRRKSEEIVIGNHIRVVVIDIVNGKVRLGIEAPRETIVHRKEVYERLQQQGRST